MRRICGKFKTPALENTRMVNDATLDVITEFEGFVDRWYPDPAYGWKVPTCCYGHTDAAGPPLFSETTTKRFTKDEGREILRRDLARVEASVKALLGVPVNANQFGAIVSFAFNVGEGNLKRSTLLRRVNAGNFTAAAAEFTKWNKAGKPLKVLKGLTRRRAAEAVLFLTPTLPVQAPKPPAATPTPANDDTARQPPIMGLLGYIIAGTIAIGAAIVALFQNGATP